MLHVYHTPMVCLLHIGRVDPMVVLVSHSKLNNLLLIGFQKQTHSVYRMTHNGAFYYGGVMVRVRL